MSALCYQLGSSAVVIASLKLLTKPLFVQFYCQAVRKYFQWPWPKVLQWNHHKTTLACHLIERGEVNNFRVQSASIIWFMIDGTMWQNKNSSVEDAVWNLWVVSKDTFLTMQATWLNLKSATMLFNLRYKHTHFHAPTPSRWTLFAGVALSSVKGDVCEYSPDRTWTWLPAGHR